MGAIESEGTLRAGTGTNVTFEYSQSTPRNSTKCSSKANDPGDLDNAHRRLEVELLLVEFLRVRDVAFLDFRRCQNARISEHLDEQLGA
jgi:hypothetical protein